MKNFIVKYKGDVIGTVTENRYVPAQEARDMKGVFQFLKEEIPDINQINFFKNRIQSCSRFEGADVFYSTDGYTFEEK